MKIKGMDKNMQCRGFQFEVGKEYKIETNGKELELCTNTVFHYCNSLQQVHNYYNCTDKSNRYFEIEVLGEEVSDDKKCGSNHIRILREITGEELAKLKGLVRSNSGLFNYGDFNSGQYNIGLGNSGNCNGGNNNSGDYNFGNNNSNYRNFGNNNSGNYNFGNKNSGNFNFGDCNSGIANKCNDSNGVFCTEEDMNIRIFNKPSGMSLKDFYESSYYDAITSVPFVLTEWIKYSEDEKGNNEIKERIGGYLKTYTMEEAWANWWSRLSDVNKKIIQEIPNFDPEIFKNITGIEVEKI